MPNPVPTVFPPNVSLSFDFSDWQTTHPTEPLPGDQLDAQLVTLANADNSVRAFIDPAFNDDGTLANNTVGPNQLTQAAKDQVGKPNADAAAASAAAAAGSASQAATSASNAAGSASQANTSAGNASGSASTAQTAATAAQSSATAASGSATSAATANTNAQAAKTAAASSATAAQGSATAAANSANAAAQSATDFGAQLTAHKLDENNPHKVSPAQVQNTQPLWNAALIYNHEVTNAPPNPGDVLSWDGAGGKIVWAIPGTIPPGASYVPIIDSGDVSLVLTATGAPSQTDWLPAADATARANALTAQNTADAARQVADAALPRAGGTMTGHIVLAADGAAPLNPVAFRQLATYAPLASPAFTGAPTAPTPPPGDADTSLATTAFVAASYAPIASPAFTGNPTAPTPAPGDNDTSLATTAFVQTAIGGVQGGAVIADTLPASPPGTLGWNSVDGQLYVRYNDGNSTQWVAATTVEGAADTATHAYVDAGDAAAQRNIGRNLVHNSLFAVAQRGPGPFTAFGFYAVDRWIINGATDTLSTIQIAMSDTARAAIGDEEAYFALNSTVTGNAAAGAYSNLAQRIENVRRLAGKTVTVSFWSNASVAGLKLGINIVQNFGTGGSPSAPAAVLATGNSVTLSTTWTRYSMTIAIPSVAGKTFGTTAGTDFTTLQFWYSSGANANAQAGNIGVQSGTINLWGVQCEVGSLTPLEKPDPADDLRRCQRFYQTGNVVFWGYQAAGATYGNSFLLPVVMRALPSNPVFTPAGNVNVGAITTGVTAPGSIYFWGSATATAPLTINGSFTVSADL